MTFQGFLEVHHLHYLKLSGAAKESVMNHFRKAKVSVAREHFFLLQDSKVWVCEPASCVVIATWDLELDLIHTWCDLETAVLRGGFWDPEQRTNTLQVPMTNESEFESAFIIALTTAKWRNWDTSVLSALLRDVGFPLHLMKAKVNKVGGFAFTVRNPNSKAWRTVSVQQWLSFRRELVARLERIPADDDRMITIEMQGKSPFDYFPSVGELEKRQQRGA